jgi:hypothetical protein
MFNIFICVLVRGVGCVWGGDGCVGVLYICMYMNICILYKNTYSYTYINICSIYICVCVCVCRGVYICTCVCMCICV